MAEEVKKNEPLLIIYSDKETGMYKSFDVSRTFNKEELQKRVEAYNKSDKKCNAHLYDDQLLLGAFADIYCSISRSNFIESIKNIENDIRHAVRDAEDMCNQLKELLDEEEEE